MDAMLCYRNARTCVGSRLGVTEPYAMCHTLLQRYESYSSQHMSLSVS